MTKLKSLKKHQIFLLVAFSLLLLSLITVFIFGAITYSNYQTNNPYLNNSDLVKSDHFDSGLVIAIIYLIFSSYIIAIAGIGCIYKILKYDIKGLAKVCYIIAAIIAVFVIVFHIRYLVGTINSCFLL